jgi:copper chaperone CopZ
MATFGVTGMTCPACAASIEKALHALNGVQSTEVSYDKAVAIVTFDPTLTEPEALIATVRSAGGAEHPFDVGQLPEPKERVPRPINGS